MSFAFRLDKFSVEFDRETSNRSEPIDEEFSFVQLSTNGLALNHNKIVLFDLSLELKREERWSEREIRSSDCTCSFVSDINDKFSSSLVRLMNQQKRPIENESMRFRRKRRIRLDFQFCFISMSTSISVVWVKFPSTRTLEIFIIE